MNRLSHAFLAFVSPLMFGAAALGQCGEGWVYGPAEQLPASGTPLLWDTDGSGPLPPSVVWLGNFYLPGKPATFMQRAAFYNNGVTQILGDEPFVAGATGGQTSSTGLTSATIHNNELYICGSILTIGGRAINNVARWDGAHWQSVGNGLYFINGASTTANNIFSIGGSLYLFTKTNTGSVYHFAKWTGATWQVDPFPQPNGYISNIVTGPDGLYMVGSFTSIGGAGAIHLAKFDGTQFSPVGPALPGFSDTPTIGFYGGVLHAFGTLSGSKQLYKLVGNAWVSVPGAPAAFAALTEYDGALYGVDNSAGSGEPHVWWRWNGSAWSKAAIFDQSIPFGDPSVTVVNNGVVYFSAGTIGGTPSPTAGQWDGVNWRAMTGCTFSGTQGSAIRDLQVHGGELYGCGVNFAYSRDGRPIRTLARWTPQGWEDVPTPFGANDYTSRLGSWKGELLVVHGNNNGSSSGYVPATVGLDRWDGTHWRSMLAGLFSRNPLDTELGPFVTHNGKLISASPLVYWDESSWRPLAPYDSVSCVYSLNQQLFVGGNFTSFQLGQVPANRVGRFDGVSLRPMEYGMNNDVYGFASYQGQLLALGRFTQASGDPARGIARWTGTRWEAVPTDGLQTSQLGGDFQFRTAIEYAGELYAIGPGRLNSVTPSALVFKWNGQTWSTLDGDAPWIGPGQFEIFNDELFMAGSVNDAYNGYPAGFARWRRTGVPTVSAPPVDAASPTNGTAGFSAGVSGATTYQWQHEVGGTFVNLNDGSQPSGTVVSGSNTAALNLGSVHAAEAGRYRLVATGSCGPVTTFPARLTVNP